MDPRRLLQEVLYAATVAGFQMFTAFAGQDALRPGSKTIDFVGLALLVVGPLMLPLRHRLPWAVVGTAVVAGIVYFSLGYPGAAIFATVIVALISLRRSRQAEERELREQENERRAAEERLSMARDLHDVLAHSLSVVQVQAGVALHLADSRPEQVRPALSAIRSASDEGMWELRFAVAALRRDGAAPLAPSPGLVDLPQLVASARAGGLHVTTSMTGSTAAVPTTIDLAAYRVVQEALTNTVRHGQARRCDVRVAQSDALVVTVVDDGRGGEAIPGNGVRGMQERVASLGGTLEVGPRPGGGFRVRAAFPL